MLVKRPNMFMWSLGVLNYPEISAAWSLQRSSSNVVPYWVCFDFLAGDFKVLPERNYIGVSNLQVCHYSTYIPVLLPLCPSPLTPHPGHLRLLAREASLCPCAGLLKRILKLGGSRCFLHGSCTHAFKNSSCKVDSLPCVINLINAEATAIAQSANESFFLNLLQYHAGPDYL